MNYKIFFKKTVYYCDDIEISTRELDNFFRFLVEERDYQWSVIHQFQAMGQEVSLIQGHLDYFIDKLIFNATHSNDLEAIEVKETE